MGMALIKRDVLDGSSFVQHRELQIGRDLEMECVLEAGSYVVVPRTSGCQIRRPTSAVDPESVSLINEDGHFTDLF